MLCDSTRLWLAALTVISAGCTAGPRKTAELAYIPSLQQKVCLGPAIGLGKDRMKCRNPDAHFDTYRAVWDRSADRLHVYIENTGVHLFGNSYDVYLIDEDLRVVRRGELSCSDENDSPYALVEMRCDSDVLPPEARDQWILGVAFAHYELRFDPRRPTRIVRELLVTSRYNQVRVEPIIWKEWGHMEEVLPREVKIVYRWAESALAQGAMEY
jgi:hypothetical protein